MEGAGRPTMLPLAWREVYLPARACRCVVRLRPGAGMRPRDWQPLLASEVKGRLRPRQHQITVWQGSSRWGGGGGRESSTPLTAPPVGQPPARMGGASGPWAAGCGAGGSRCPYGGDWWAGGGAGGGGRQRRAAATGPHWLGGVARPTQAQPSRCGAAASRDWMRGNRRRQPRKRANQRRGKEKNRTQVPTDRPTCEPCPLPLFPQCPVLFICVYTEPGWRSTHARAMTSPRTTASTGPAAAALQVCAHPRERPVVCLSRVR